VLSPQEKKKPSEKKTGSTEHVVVLSKDYRQEVSAATSKTDKVALFAAAATEVGQRVREGKEPIDPLKNWAHHAGKVAECVAKCHGGDVGKFLEETANFRVGKWACCHAVKHKACFDRAKF
jgi:hypothetical protein